MFWEEELKFKVEDIIDFILPLLTYPGSYLYLSWLLFCHSSHMPIHPMGRIGWCPDSQGGQMYLEIIQRQHALEGESEYQNVKIQRYNTVHWHKEKLNFKNANAYRSNSSMLVFNYPSWNTCQEECSRAKTVVVELGEDELVLTYNTKESTHLYHQTSDISLWKP